MNPIPLFRPAIDAREHDYVIKAMRSGWLGLGPMTAEFEGKFATHLGVKHAVMTSSCTAALELALLAHGIGPGDRVAVPTMTFVATAHAVQNVGAEVVLCDVFEGNLLMIPPTDTDAYVPVLYAGQPWGMRFVNLERGKDHSPPMIWDCAHAVGSSFNASGKTCCWSFHAVKNLTTGEGGMLTTDDDVLAAKARRMRWLGIDKSTHDRSKEQVYSWQYEVSYPGRKAHGNDLAAAVGLSQLEKLPEMQSRRQWLWNRYANALPNLMRWIPGHSCLLAVLRHERRDDLANHLAKREIQSGVHYKSLTLTEAYWSPGSCPVAERVWQELLTLPLYVSMTDQDQDRVIQSIKEFGE